VFFEGFWFFLCCFMLVFCEVSGGLFFYWVFFVLSFVVFFVVMLYFFYLFDIFVCLFCVFCYCFLFVLGGRFFD